MIAIALIRLSLENGNWYRFVRRIQFLEITRKRLFTQPFIQAQIKENIKAPGHWRLLEEFPGEFPAQKSSNGDNVSIWWRHHVLHASAGLGF